MSKNLTSEKNTILPEIKRNNKIFKTRNENQLKNLDINNNNINKTLKRGQSNFYKIRKSNFNSFINQSITELKNRKSFMKNNSFFKKNTFILNSDNNKQKILKQKNDEDNSHKVKISKLLNNAKNFFNNLGIFLEENKPKEIPYLNANKIYKRLSTVKKKDILFPQTIKNKQNNINKLYGRMYSIKILNDENKNNKNRSLIVNKSILNHNTIEEYETKNTNNSADLGKKKKGKKSYNDQIIQTFNFIDKDKNNINENVDNYNSTIMNNNINIIDNNNNTINNNTNLISDNNEQNINEESKSDYDNNIFTNKRKENFHLPLPLINYGKYKNDIVYDKNKNDIKIAEIREIYPCYPYNRIINFTNSTRANNKKYKNNKFYNDYRFVSNTRYYYEKFLRDIKLSNNDPSESFFNNYGTKRKRNKTNKVKNIYIN